MAVISASFYFGWQKVQADGSINYGALISQQKISVSKDENFILSKYKNGRDINWVLTKTGFWSNLNLTLVGFEDSIQLCQQNVYQISDVRALCLSGYAGAHAENVVLIDLARFEPVAFENGQTKSYNIVSDVPYFIFSNDNSESFITDMRNYDKNPLTDSIRSYYHWVGNIFIFDKEENITYDGNYKILNAI